MHASRRALGEGVPEFIAKHVMVKNRDQNATRGCLKRFEPLDGGKAIYRGSGSIDVIGVARSAMAVAIHPDDPELRVMAHVKHNLSARGDSQLYALVHEEN